MKIENEEINSNPFGQLEEECAQYVAGYVASRFSHKYPDLVDETGEHKAGWIKQLSKGNLKIPSEKIMNAMKIIEIAFIQFHGDNLVKTPWVMKTLTNIVLPKINYLNIPVEVVKCLVRTRTFIRMNNLNKIVLEKQLHTHRIKKSKFTN